MLIRLRDHDSINKSTYYNPEFITKIIEVYKVDEPDIIGSHIKILGSERLDFVKETPEEIKHMIRIARRAEQKETL